MKYIIKGEGQPDIFTASIRVRTLSASFISRARIGNDYQLRVAEEIIYHCRISDFGAYY